MNLHDDALAQAIHWRMAFENLRAASIEHTRLTPPSLVRVSSDGMRAILTARGWAKASGTSRDMAEGWRKGDGPVAWVPYTVNADTFTMVGVFFTALAQTEGVAPVELLVEALAAQPMSE